MSKTNRKFIINIDGLSIIEYHIVLKACFISIFIFICELIKLGMTVNIIEPILIKSRHRLRFTPIVLYSTNRL